MISIIRAILGFVVVLFVPGYAATWAFFPKGNEIDGLERLALSIGLSISLVVLTIYAMNAVFGVPINTLTSLLAIFTITFAGSAVGYVRMRRLAKQKKK
jgi:uncharacterized membrane protein